MSQRIIAESAFPVNERMGFQRGDEAAVRAALALAERCDAPTIQAITDAFAFVLRMGGQVHGVTLREQNAEGEYETLGISILYESRDARMQQARAPKEVLGIEVRDFSKPAVEVSVEPDAASEAEADAPAEEDQDLSFEEPEAPGVLEEPDPVGVE